MLWFCPKCGWGLSLINVTCEALDEAQQVVVIRLIY